MEKDIEKRFLEILGKKGKANPLDIANELNLDITNDELDSFVESLYARDIISEPHKQYRSGSLPKYDSIIFLTKNKEELAQSTYKVFISYSREDASFVSDLTKILDKTGLKYFLDIKDIPWGGNVSEDIKKALKESSEILVVVSPASLKSHWVPYEIGYASALEKTILPLLTDSSLEPPIYLKILNYKTTLKDVEAYFHTRIGLSKTNNQRQKKNIPDLTKEAKELLLEATLDGTIMINDTLEGFSIQSNNKKFGEPRNHRSRAMWEGVIEKLLNYGLIKQIGNKDDYFELTHEGYILADALRDKQTEKQN